MESGTILEVRDLKVHFPIRRGVFARTVGFAKAVDGVSFSLKRGGTLGIVGESGSGKSTASRAILGLVKPCGGEILVDGRPVGEWNPSEYRRKVQAVFQDPAASLNPRHTICEIVTEGAVYHGLCAQRAARDRAAELLGMVGLGADCLDRYPHEFSGGQRQRVCIARAIALEPELVICDEAVASLDLTIRAQVLDLLSGLKDKMGLSLLFITHDIGVVRRIADTVAVMNRGRIVEQGNCREVLSNPKEQYTRELVAAVPRLPPVVEGAAAEAACETGGDGR